MANPIFKEHIDYYLEKVRGMDLEACGHRLGIEASDGQARITLFGRGFTVNDEGIFTPSGARASYDVCIILSKYLLMCPDDMPTDAQWVAYRDLKDSGPLTTYFSQDVESAMTGRFAGAVAELAHAADLMGADDPEAGLAYDLVRRFEALPRVPLLLLFNDADAEFAARCSVLFERRAEAFLDCECLAMLAVLLVNSLKSAADKGRLPWEG